LVRVGSLLRPKLSFNPIFHQDLAPKRLGWTQFFTLVLGVRIGWRLIFGVPQEVPT